MVFFCIQQMYFLVRQCTQIAHFPILMITSARTRCAERRKSTRFLETPADHESGRSDPESGNGCARGVRLPKLRTVRPKWVLTTGQAVSLLETLSPLPRAMVGLALLSGLRRGELFALRWRDLDEQARLLTVREAVYEGRFGTPKTEAGLRQIPFSAATLQVMAEWRRYVKKAEPEALVFSTRSGKPISPNNVLRRWIFPACTALNLPNATWLTFRRTYSSWAHDKGVPAKVVSQLLGHAKIDTTLNVYTQVLDDALRTAVETVGTELFRIVQKPEMASELTH